MAWREVEGVAYQEVGIGHGNEVEVALGAV